MLYVSKLEGHFEIFRFNIRTSAKPAKVIKFRKNMEGKSKCHCKFSGFEQQPLLSEEDANISLSSHRSQPSEIGEEHM